MKYVKQESKHTKCAYRALTLSGISFFTAILNTLIFPFIFSPLALIFSHLSRGRVKEKHVAAQAATVIAIVSLIINLALVGLNVYRLFYDESYREELNATSQILYGESFDDKISDIFGSVSVAEDAN